MKVLMKAFFPCMLFLALAATGHAAEQKFSWRLASVWSEGLVMLDSEREFAKKVEEMSGGRLIIKVFPAGQIGPTNQVLDLVRSGAVEMGADWPGYWIGKNTAFDLLGSHVMGFTPLDHAIWIYAADGMGFYDEFFGAYNVKYFPHHIADQESGIRSNKPIKNLEDFKGLKIRMGNHIPGRVIQAFGAQPVTMASGEIYEAIQRGVIDGCEMNIPLADFHAKLQEVAKYWLTPGWHQTASLDGILVNKDKWNSLPPDLQAIVKYAAQAQFVESLAKTTYGSVDATADILASGVTATRLSDADLERIEVTRNEILSQMASENPDFARALKSIIDLDKKLAAYRNNTRPWSFGRTWKHYPVLPQ
jgi:TRAP-type mannitol/chloroaromatic compound transport system substrate-binding protein